MTITVTKEEFFAFIKSQPDERELDFDECNCKSQCGCPMVHYAKEMFSINLLLEEDDHDVRVNYYSWYYNPGDRYLAFASFEDGIDFSSFCFFEEDYLGETVTKTTYGQLKAHLSQKHPDFNWN